MKLLQCVGVQCEMQRPLGLDSQPSRDITANQGWTSSPSPLVPAEVYMMALFLAMVAPSKTSHHPHRSQPSSLLRIFSPLEVSRHGSEGNHEAPADNSRPLVSRPVRCCGRSSSSGELVPPARLLPSHTAQSDPDKRALRANIPLGERSRSTEPAPARCAVFGCLRARARCWIALGARSSSEHGGQQSRRHEDSG